MQRFILKVLVYLQMTRKYTAIKSYEMANKTGPSTSNSKTSVPDVEIDLHCVETLSDYEDEDRGSFYADSRSAFKDNDVESDGTCITDLFPCDDCPEGAYCDRCVQKRKGLFEEGEENEASVKSESQEDTTVKLTKIKPRETKTSSKDDSEIGKIEDKDEHKVPELCVDDPQQVKVKEGNEGESQATTDGEDDDASTVLSQLSISDDSPEPSQPERILDSCYIGDHFVPFLEE